MRATETYARMRDATCWEVLRRVSRVVGAQEPHVSAMTTDRSFSLGRTALDRRFCRVLGLSALAVGGATAGLLALARHREPALTTPCEETRLAALRRYIHRQEERGEGGTGARHAGAEGTLGGRVTPVRNARYAVRNNAAPPHLSRAAARTQVQTRGIFAALQAPSAGIVSPFGSMTGDEVGDAYGSGGLGATGTGWGGGGTGGTIGMGNVGTTGHGAGTGSGQGYGSGSARGFAAPVVRPVVSLDPNGRFATTYRPGHGHTAWFDASVARGEMPAATRDLLAELGSHEEPVMAAPVDQALDLRVDLERASLAPTGGPVRLRLALRSSAATVARPTMSVHLVMDISGSMGGDPIVHAREAAHALVERLHDGDHFSLTVFASDARAAVPEGTVGPRRGEILRVIDAIDVEGGTNISAGLSLGYRMAAHGPAVTSANRLVLLLSDGEPTDGITDRDALANMAAVALQEGGIETTSVGVGTRYDGALMSAVADRGAGGYYYVPDSAHIAEALRTELESQSTARRAVESEVAALQVRVRRLQGQLSQAYQRIKSDDGLVSRAKKALSIALTLLDESGAPLAPLPEDGQPTEPTSKD